VAGRSGRSASRQAGQGKVGTRKRERSNRASERAGAEYRVQCRECVVQS
jgi:hypothetical protein